RPPAIFPRRSATSPRWRPRPSARAWRRTPCAPEPARIRRQRGAADGAGAIKNPRRMPGVPGARGPGSLVLLFRYAGLLEQLGPLRHLLLHLGVQRLGIGLVVQHFRTQARHAFLELRIG